MFLKLFCFLYFQIFSHQNTSTPTHCWNFHGLVKKVGKVAIIFPNIRVFLRKSMFCYSTIIVYICIYIYIYIYIICLFLKKCLKPKIFWFSKKLTSSCLFLFIIKLYSRDDIFKNFNKVKWTLVAFMEEVAKPR